jgi:hypothetical protein
MNIDENEFEFEGKTYVAVEGAGCEGCHIMRDHSETMPCLGSYERIPACLWSDRSDKRNKVFKEKQ